MKKYPKYKDSGVEWIGEIPIDWGFIKGKYLFGHRNDKNHPEEPLLSVTQNQSVVRRDELEMRVWNPQDDISGYKLIVDGDFVISLRTFEGGIELSKIKGIVSPVYTPLYRKLEIEEKYFKFLFKSERFITELNKITTGIRQGKNISYDDFSEIILPLPHLVQQKLIGVFLEQKTTIIDDLIQKKQRKIELLKEHRTSIINQTVTKGLNPDVKMKDSGVEWIGEIPEHWSCIPIKYSLEKSKESIKTGPFGSQLKSDDMVQDGIRIYNQRTVYDEDFKNGEIFVTPEKYETLKGFTVLNGDVLVTSRGTIGKMSIVPEGSDIGVLHPCLIRLRIDTKLLSKQYLWWYMNHSSIFIESVKIESNTTTIDVIYSNTLSNTRFPLPPISEQLQIVEYLDQKTNEIDTTITLENKKIDLLKEYRQSLISEVVTGKIDVRKN